VAANARLTATLAAVLLALLAAEGVTVLRVGALLTLHVFIGTLLAPRRFEDREHRLPLRPLLRRFTSCRRKGPPPPALRVLGPWSLF